MSQANNDAVRTYLSEWSASSDDSGRDEAIEALESLDQASPA
jgi:hypothetical protein